MSPSSSYPMQFISSTSRHRAARGLSLPWTSPAAFRGSRSPPRLQGGSEGPRTPPASAPSVPLPPPPPAGRMGGAEAPPRLSAIGAVSTSAELLGGSQRVLEMATQYAKDRIQFGVPIGRDRKSTRLNSSHLGISYAV